MRAKIAGALGVFCLAAGLSPAQAPPPANPPAALPRASGAVMVQPTVPYEAPLLNGACCPEPDCRGPRLYGGGEVLYWKTREYDLPPLATTGPLDSFGIIGEPGTQVILGGDISDDDRRFGGRFTIGAWLNRHGTLGAEATYFFLSESTESRAVASAGDTVLAVPIVDNFGENSLIIAGPDALDTPGLVALSSKTRLQGFELNLRCRAGQSANFQLDFLGGFRYLNLEDDLVIVDQGLDPLLTDFEGFLIPNNFFGIDRFDTQNRFAGPQLGVQTKVALGRFTVGVLGKVALGITNQRVEIFGNAVDVTLVDSILPGDQGDDVTPPFVTPAGTPLKFPFNILAANSNIGSHTHNEFAVLSQVNVKVGYQVTDNLHAFAGYEFLYLNRVVRPGDQIDRSFPSPTVNFRQSDFWARGLTFGLEFNY